MSIAATLKAQLLGQFIDALAGAAAAGANAQRNGGLQAALLQGLQPGQTLQATVTGALPDGRLILLLNGQQAAADLRGAALPAEARLPGTVLRLQVEAAGDVPRLSFAGVEAQARPPGTVPLPASQQQGLTLQQGAAPASSSTPALAEIRVVSPPLAVSDQALRTQARPALNPAAGTIARAAAEAAARQGSAAPLYADLAAALSRPDLNLPAAVLTLAAQLLSGRLNGETPVTPDALKEAILRSGALQESLTARAVPAAPDAKALLTALRDVLSRDPLLSRETLRSEAPPAAARLPDVEPPRRDGAVIAQRPAQASLGPQASADAVAATLAREADQAVGRITLHQIASLAPERALAALLPADAQRPQQLSFEIPLAFGQQTAMAAFRIERDRKRKTRPDEPTDVWGVRFAIDADVLGPVHAHVRLAGQTISVSLWAEQADTHRIFVAAIPRLEAALAENALEVGALTVLPGRPAEIRPAVSSHFLDRRS
jgi:Flagellar hook-length control protein FliK